MRNYLFYVIMKYGIYKWLLNWWKCQYNFATSCDTDGYLTTQNQNTCTIQLCTATILYASLVYALSRLLLRVPLISHLLYFLSGSDKCRNEASMSFIRIRAFHLIVLLFFFPPWWKRSQVGQSKDSIKASAWIICTALQWNESRHPALLSDWTERLQKMLM